MRSLFLKEAKIPLVAVVEYLGADLAQARAVALDLGIGPTVTYEEAEDLAEFLARSAKAHEDESDEDESDEDESDEDESDEDESDEDESDEDESDEDEEE